MKSEQKNQKATDCLIAFFTPLLGIFIIFGARILNGESLYLGIVQEQYFLLGQFSFDHLIRSEFSQGLFPLWNPNNALGTPLLANMLSAVFYPLKIFLYLFPCWLSYELMVIFRFWLGGFFTYWLARKLNLSRWAGVFASLGFCFSGYFILFLNENYLNADFILPLLVLLGIKVWEKPSLKWTLLLAFCVFALLNSGHPEAIFYNWLFFVLFFLCFALRSEKKKKAGAVLGFGLANALGIFLSLAFLLPFIEFWSRGWHFHIPGAGLYHYSIREFLALFSPWFFGKSEPGKAFFHLPEFSVGAEHIFPEYSKTALPWLAPSLGLIFLPLIILGFIEAKRLKSWAIFCLLWILIFIGLSFGLPGFQFLGLIFPFNLSGNFKHPFPGIILCFNLLGAVLLERIFFAKVQKKNILIALLASILIILIFFPWLDLEKAKNIELASELFLMGIFFFWLFFFCQEKWADKIGWIVASGLVLLSGLNFSGWQEPVYTGYHLTALRQSKVFQRLKEKKELYRFYFTKEIFPPNLSQLLDSPDLRVMDGINHHRLVKLVNFINKHTREEGFKYWYHKVGYLEVMPERIEHPLLDLIGVKYIITRSPLPYNRLIERILEKAKITAPEANHIGMDYFPAQNQNAQIKTLFQHPPSRLEFNICSTSPEICEQRLAGFIFIPPKYAKFSPQINPKVWEKERDGCWFLIFQGENLLYARHIFPKAHTNEQSLGQVELYLERLPTSSPVLSLVTLPQKTKDFDWAGWMNFNEIKPRLRFKFLGADKFWFYENPFAFPRVFLVDKDEVFKGGAELKDITEWLSWLRFEDFREELKRKAEIDIWERGVKIIRSTSQSYEIITQTTRPYWLIISELNYPGWRAYLDGKEVKLERVFFLFDGIFLPAGRHRIEIVYQPLSFGIGIYFAFATIFSIVIFCSCGLYFGLVVKKLNLKKC